MSRKVNLSGQEVVTAKQHNEALAHAKNLIKDQQKRIAELEAENMELRHFIERWSACPNPHTEMADTGGHLDETPCGACLWCNMADEYEVLREATDPVHQANFPAEASK